MCGSWHFPETDHEFSFLWPKPLAVLLCLVVMLGIWDIPIYRYTLILWDVLDKLRLETLIWDRQNLFLMHPHAILSHINWHRSCPATVSADEWIHLKSIQSSSYLYFVWPPIPISTPFIFCSWISLSWLPSQTPVIASAAQLLRWSMRVIQQDIMDPISSSWLLETKTSPHGSWFYGTSGWSFYSGKWGKRRRSIAYPWVKLRSYDIIFLQCYMLMFVKLSDWFQLQIWNQDRFW